MSGKKLTTTAIVANPQGMHLRAARQFAQCASQFRSRIEVCKDDLRVDGKGAMHLLLLVAEQGTTLAIEAEGPDAEQALAALKQMLESPPPFDDALVEDGGPGEGAPPSIPNQQ